MLSTAAWRNGDPAKTRTGKCAHFKSAHDKNAPLNKTRLVNARAHKSIIIHQYRDRLYTHTFIVNHVSFFCLEGCCNLTCTRAHGLGCSEFYCLRFPGSQTYWVFWLLIMVFATSNSSSFYRNGPISLKRCPGHLKSWF